MNKMQKIAVIAGEGDLPLEIVKKCQDKRVETLILRASDENFKLSHEEHLAIDFNNLANTIELLKKNEFENLVFAGRVSHSLLFDKYHDLRILTPDTADKVSSLGDNSYFSGIVKFVENIGFKVIGVHEILEDSLASKGVLSAIKPSVEQEKDAYLGFDIAKKISDFDIGQALVIDDGFILGIEAIEGTDNLIKRCKDFKSPTRSGVLVKIKKNNQENKIDMPVIGQHTMKEVFDANLAGIALEAGSCILIDKMKTINTANKLGIFILGI